MINSKKLWIVRGIMRLLPETSCWNVKRILLRWCGIKIGHGSRICSSVTILGAGMLEIGEDVWIGHQALLICAGRIYIGDHCDIAPRVLLETGTHEITPDSPHVAGNGVVADVNLGDGCWLCAASNVLPRVAIGEKAVVAAGAVVTHDVPAYSVWGGVPAREIRKLK